MNGNPILEEDENQRIIHALQDLKEPGGKLYDAYSEVKDALEQAGFSPKEAAEMASQAYQYCVAGGCQALISQI
jgi:hypothetical protein